MPALAAFGIAEQLHLQPQLEIAVRLLRAEELIARRRLVQAAPDDCAVLDVEEIGITFPAVEGLAVKERVVVTPSGVSQMPLRAHYEPAGTGGRPSCWR